MYELSTKKILEKAEEYYKFNWFEEAEKFYRIVLAKNPNDPKVNHKLGDLAMKVNKPEVALVFFEKALKFAPKNLQFQKSLDNAKLKLEEIADCNIFTLRGSDFIFDRKIKSLENKIILLNEKLNNMHEALNYLDIFEMKDIDDTSSRMLPVEVVDKGATKTLLAFGGMAAGLSMPPKEFFKSLTSKNMNIIFVKDFRQCWYQKGLLGKTNNLSDSISYLKNLIPETTEKLITLGASAGGYAAIRFGVALNANRIMAFSPQTLIDEETVKVFSKSCLKDMIFGSDDLDLKIILEKYNKEQNIEVYYGRNNNRDRDAVDHIKDYVKAFSYETDSHLLASYLKERGILQELLDSI